MVLFVVLVKSHKNDVSRSQRTVFGIHGFSDFDFLRGLLVSAIQCELAGENRVPKQRLRGFPGVNSWVSLP
jgi:hypothetical protein